MSKYLSVIFWAFVNILACIPLVHITRRLTDNNVAAIIVAMLFSLIYQIAILRLFRRPKRSISLCMMVTHARIWIQSEAGLHHQSREDVRWRL